MDLLYHYASNQKGFGILNDRAIRLSDIRKSNDYEELFLLYPDIFEDILAVYKESPFDFQYECQNGEKALKALLEITYHMINDSIESGDLTNFVVCFSEQADLLSQWRGYANDGQVISIGFSKELLQRKCKEDNSVFRLEKVAYICEEKRKEIVKKKAFEVVESLRDLRKWIIENMTHDASSPDTDGLLQFNFHGMIENIMIESLMYKQIGFEEEKEWRIFLRNRAYKNPDWVLGEDCKMIGPNMFSETLSFLRNKISFNVTDNNIFPYIPLLFSEIGDEVIKEIWIGPKNKIAHGDMELYLAQHGYQNTEIFFSKTSYR
ncbi:MAG: DUF2971 domain-containing protein [Anaerovoracaceae bacterium]